MPRSTDTPPPELRVGKLIEVWGADGDPGDAISAFRRYQRARRMWCEARRLGTAEERRLLPLLSSPWSTQHLIECGRRDEAVERLGQAGVTLADIPTLRAATQTHPQPD